MRRNLLLWIRQGVECFKAFLSQDLVLHRYDSRQEHIVQSLGLDPHIELLDTKCQTTHFLFVRAEVKVETGVGEALKVAQSFNVRHFGGVDDYATRKTHLGSCRVGSKWK